MKRERIGQEFLRAGTAIALVLAALAGAIGPSLASEVTSASGTKPLTLLVAQMRKGEAVPAIPQVAPYRWLASRTNGGPVVLTGYVPATALKTMLSAQAPDAVNRLQIAAGAPANFTEDAAAGMAALKLLDNGKVGYDGSMWYVAGTLAAGKARAELDAALGDAATPIVNWAITVGEAGTVAQTESPSVTTLGAATPTDTAPGGASSIETLPAESLDTATNMTTHVAEAPAAAEPEAPAAQTAAPAEPVPATEPEPAPETTPAEAPSNTASPVNTAEPTPATEAPVPIEPAQPPAETAAPAQAAAPAQPTEQTAQPAASAEPAAPAIDPDYSFAAEKSQTGIVTFAGTVPADATRRYFGVVAGGVDASALGIAAGAPESFITSGTEGLRALAQLQEGRLSFSNGKWSLNGKAESEGKEKAVQTALAALPDGQNWTVNVTAPSPLQGCQAMATAFSARNPILFESGKATIADSSAAAIEELATDLQSCPQAAVDVEGHTDADGADDLNLTLSVARAEAVVNALVAHGIDAGRLYAIGYGETLPIADNDTAAGKRQNRRIVIKVLTPEEAAKQ